MSRFQTAGRGRSGAPVLQWPVRRQDGTPLPIGSGGEVTAAQVQAAGYWAPLTQTIGVTTSLVFAAGEPIMIWTAL